MNHQQIRKFYKAYQKQILDEMQEYYDMPLKYIEKINENKYIAYEDNIKVIFTFVRRFGSDLSKLPNKIDKNLIKDYYERSWNWDESTPENERNAKNFLRVIGSSFSITKNFLQTKPNIKIILFTSLSSGHDTIYNDKSRYSKKLLLILGDQYEYITDPENFRYWIVNKDVIDYKSQNHIQLRMEILGETLNESIQFRHFPLRHSSTPINIIIKNKIKQRILENIYL